MKQPGIDIFAEVKDDLEAIETALRQNLTAHLDIVMEASKYILFAGGKRLRPLLTVLCARVCGCSGSHIIRLATVFEYLHAATLLHDDLIDNAYLRRGKPVAHSIWGNSISVLVGDFLLARSLSLIAETNNMKIIDVIADITENMSQGEIHQLISKENPSISETEYMEVIRRKTAVLIQGACQVGALISKATEEETAALSAYGLHTGIAFQIADDLLDYTSDTRTLGKGVGADLKEGKVTLPLIYTLKEAAPNDRRRMEKMIRDQNFSEADFMALKEMLERYGGINYARRVSFEHIKTAKDALCTFTMSKPLELLINIADFALDRAA